MTHPSQERSTRTVTPPTTDNEPAERLGWEEREALLMAAAEILAGEGEGWTGHQLDTLARAVAVLAATPQPGEDQYDSMADYEEHMAALGDPDIEPRP